MRNNKERYDKLAACAEEFTHFVKKENIASSQEQIAATLRATLAEIKFIREHDWARYVEAFDKLVILQLAAQFCEVMDDTVLDCSKAEEFYKDGQLVGSGLKHFKEHLWLVEVKVGEILHTFNDQEIVKTELGLASMLLALMLDLFNLFYSTKLLAYFLPEQSLFFSNSSEVFGITLAQIFRFSKHLQQGRSFTHKDYRNATEYWTRTLEIQESESELAFYRDACDAARYICNSSN